MKVNIGGMMKEARFAVSFEYLAKALLLPEGTTIKWVEPSEWVKNWVTIAVESNDFDGVETPNGLALWCRPTYETQPDGKVIWEDWGIVGEL